MTHPDSPTDHVSDYERAICYYTLPKVTSPVTFRSVVVYFVVLFPAALVTCYGVLRADSAWIGAGLIALGAVTIIGLILFSLHALLNELHRRSVLAVARGIPDADTDTDTPDVPDPFANHRLIGRPMHSRRHAFSCTDNKGEVCYNVQHVSHDGLWRVTDPEGGEVLRVRAHWGSRSFSIDQGSPGRFAVYVGELEVGRIRRRFSFAAPLIEIECFHPIPKKYVVRQRSIYDGERLVGRVYVLRSRLYLDIETPECHEPVLAFFVAMD